MKRKILVVAALMLLALLSQFALADIEVVSYNAYCVDMDDYKQTWTFYEIINTGSETVKLSSDSIVTLLDANGNELVSDTIVFQPGTVEPGQKSYGVMGTAAGDNRITSVEQIADFHLNIITDVPSFRCVYFDPTSTKFEAKDTLFGLGNGMKITIAASYKNETDALQSMPNAVFVLRDENGKLVFVSYETFGDVLHPGKTGTIEGYVPDAVRRFFRKNDFKPASMEVILYDLETA